MKIIDYNFSSLNVANPDGSLPAQATNCTVVAGPGSIATGNFAKALDFGTSGKLQVTLVPTPIKTERFCIRVVFKVDAAVDGRQNIIESNCLPFALFLDKTAVSGVYKVVVSVAPADYGWSGCNTEFFKELKAGTWYTADLVYDIDTVGVFIDGVLLSVHAYPSGKIVKNTTSLLVIGKSVDGTKYQFKGKLAAAQWFNDEIPADLELQLDERRNHPEWFLSYKHEEALNDMNVPLGNLAGKYSYDANAGAYVQLYDAGLIMYNQDNGAAFEMHGAIYQFYKAANKAELGYLVSDETKTTKVSGRKNLFSKGGIYWSQQTNAIAVTGQLYVDYEGLGESTAIGWPVSAALAIANGKEQAFQNGKMYYKNGTPKAFEVHGTILAKFISSGGIAKWGYPVCNECDVMNGTALIGKSSEFEGTTIYFKDGIGAFEVHGDVRRKYLDMNGPCGLLGFPTSDETDIPGAAGSRYNTFQAGTITWFGSWESTIACTAFNIHLGSISTKETEGDLMGSNDIYLDAIVEENGNQLTCKRFGEKENHNVRNIDKHLDPVLVPNAPGKKYRMKLIIKDADPGGDDLLGTFVGPELSIANAWGMRTNNGVFEAAPFERIKKISWSVIGIDNPYIKTWEKWWGVLNQGSLQKTTWAQYSAAFSDVDSQPEDWDIIDGLHKLFFDAFIANRITGGNCFGMSLHAIYAYKHRSTQGLPLNRFKDWSKVENEFNIKHLYQAGASMVWWFAGQFITGNTLNPVDVFNASHAEFLRGNNPVICISQNWDFSGAAHCILPISWDKSTKPWKIKIHDPNFPSVKSDDSNIKTLFVDPDKNEFTYEGGSKYKGGQWSGGRFHYTPFSVLNHRSRTPVAELVAVIAIVKMIFFGADTESVSLVDESGTDLNAFGADSTNRLKLGKTLDNKFVPIRGYEATSEAPRLFVRYEAQNAQFEPAKTGTVRNSQIAGMTLSELMKDAVLAQPVNMLKTHAQYNVIKDRVVSSIINDAKVMATLTPAVATALTTLVNKYATEKKFKHQLRGLKNGQMQYTVKDKLNAVSFQSAIKTGEVSNFESMSVGTGSSIMKMTSIEAKNVRLEIFNKFGSGKDHVTVIIDKIPVAAGKDIQVHIKPGLAGLDILSSGAKIASPVTIRATIGGVLMSKSFNVDIDKGLRLFPAAALKSGKLKVSKIDGLFGPTKSSQMIQGA